MPIFKAMSLRELSIRSGLSVYTLTKAIHKGELKAFRSNDAINGRLKVSEVDFLEYIESKKNKLRTEDTKKLLK